MELANRWAGLGRVRPVLLWLTVWILFSAGHSAGAEPRPDSAGDPNAASPASFIRDGRLDVNAVVDYFEDLYRADSSISTAQLKVDQAAADQDDAAEDVDPGRGSGAHRRPGAPAGRRDRDPQGR